MKTDTKSDSQATRALSKARALILGGVFAPGERLSEPLLAARLDVSRTPLREALGTLVQEGLVERLGSGRCRVSSYSTQDIIDAIEVRGTMEGLAARLAAERGASHEMMNECRTVLSSLDEAIGDGTSIQFDRYVELNASFHSWIARAAVSGILEREMDRIGRMPLASPSAFLEGQESIPAFRESLVVAQRQHHAIFEAIENREGARAEALCREHARLARENLTFVMADNTLSRESIPGLSLVTSQ
jgi:GntR family transcriptional regulator of vanillate catabolism